MTLDQAVDTVFEAVAQRRAGRDRHSARRRRPTWSTSRRALIGDRHDRDSNHVGASRREGARDSGLGGRMPPHLPPRQLLRHRADVARIAPKAEATGDKPLSREFSSADAPGRPRADRCAAARPTRLDGRARPTCTSRRAASLTTPDLSPRRCDRKLSVMTIVGHAAGAHQAQPRNRRARSPHASYARPHGPELRLTS